MTHPGDRRTDGYIAVRSAELAAALTAEAGLPPEEVQALPDVFKLLGALLRHEAYDRLEALKALYDPLDPDAPPARRDTSPAAFEAFELALAEALARANFSEVSADTVQTRDVTKKLTGLAIKPSLAGVRRIRYFARGSHKAMFSFKRWFGLKTEQIEADVLDDVIVLVGFKADSEVEKDDAKALARMRRGVRQGAALVKHFRNVAAAELVTLHPGARPSMRRRDQVFLAAPAIATGVPVLLNLWPAITVLFAVLAAYFGARGVIEDSELRRAIAAISGLVAVGAFVMRQRLKYEAQTLRYQKKLADTVYFRNLANNAGVIDFLIGAGAEQDAKEALLGYWALRRAGQPLSKPDLDAMAEAFLRERFKLETDFEIHDALGKLERLGLITVQGEGYIATDPAEALTRLDGVWDDLFKFSARR